MRRGTFLNGYHHYLLAGRAEGRLGGFRPKDWNEAEYLAINQDVAAEVARGTFPSGYHHFIAAGKREGRLGGFRPEGWNDADYLAINQDVAAEVARGTFLSGYHHFIAAGKREGRLGGFRPEGWNDADYLAINQDVAAEVARGTFLSGYHHFVAAGRREGRLSGVRPKNWNEVGYLQVNGDVATGVSRGPWASGYHQYIAAGRKEGRLGGYQPDDWDEGSYLAANPDARGRIALGDYQNGYIHYAAIGRARGYVGGLPPANAIEQFRLRWPALNHASMKIGELLRLTVSATALRDAVSTVLRQSEPATFDDTGLRVWHGQEEVVRRAGGTGAIMRGVAANARPGMLLTSHRYCFARPDTSISSFEPFRFMLRRAYAEGTDLRVYVTPYHSLIRYLFTILQLDDRYEFWLKELVRINEEEAAGAGRQALPLWDFSDPNSITREPLPPVGDLTPMRWYWEYGHFRKEAGDLILDRIFDYRDPARALPDDFGVRLTGANVDEHLARSRIAIADWAAANPKLASQMVAAVQRNNKPQT